MPNEDPTPGQSPNERRWPKTIYVCDYCGDQVHPGTPHGHSEAFRVGGVEVMPVPSSQEEDEPLVLTEMQEALIRYEQGRGPNPIGAASGTPSTQPVEDERPRIVYDCAHSNARYAEPCDDCPLREYQMTPDALHEAQMEAEHYREQLAREREARERLEVAAKELRRQMRKVQERVGGTGRDAHIGAYNVAYYAGKRFDEALSATGSGRTLPSSDSPGIVGPVPDERQTP